MLLLNDFLKTEYLAYSCYFHLFLCGYKLKSSFYQLFIVRFGVLSLFNYQLIVLYSKAFFLLIVKDSSNAIARLAVSVGIDSLTHMFVSHCIIEQ